MSKAAFDRAINFWVTLVSAQNLSKAHFPDNWDYQPSQNETLSGHQTRGCAENVCFLAGIGNSTKRLIGCEAGPQSVPSLDRRRV
jgi:hypothetical protein